MLNNTSSNPLKQPTYADLGEAARSYYLNQLSQAGKEDKKIEKRLQEFDWAFDKFLEIADIVTPAEYIDERVLVRVTMERLINNKLQSNSATRKQVMTVMRVHVRPVALQLCEQNGTYLSLASILTKSIQVKGMHIKPLATMIGMDPGTLRSWVKHGRHPTTRKNLEHLAAIEKVLELPPKTLLAYANGPRAAHLLPDDLAIEHVSLSEALTHYMKLGGYNVTHLSEAVGLKITVMNDWIRKGTVPRSNKNIEALQECENILKAPPGTLMRFTNRSTRYLEALHSDFNLTKNRFKTLRKYFPDNFDQLSAEKQKEIITWAQENTRVPLDKDDDGGERSPYRCQFRGVAHHAGFHDGVFFAPPQLQREYDALIRMHTEVPVPIGLERSHMWSEGAVSARTSFLGMFFGAVRQVAPEIPEEQYSFQLATDIVLVRKAIDHIIERRGRATPSTVLVLVTLQRLFSKDSGFIVQHRNLIAKTYSSIPKGKKYRKLCAATVKALAAERKRRRDQVRVGRYSFRSLNVVLRNKYPLDEYFRIIDYIDACTPLPNLQPMEWARNKRDSFLLHFLMVAPLRLKNVANMMLQTENKEPPTFDQLSYDGIGIIYRCDNDWWLKIPKSVFKNKSSPAASNIDIKLMDWADLYTRLDEYLEARKLLLNGEVDLNQMFVKDFTQPMSVKGKFLSAQVLSNIFLNTILTYGIYNPYTKTGAIQGLRPHRLHAMRHLVATHISKLHDYDTAASRLFDTVKTVIDNYADYQPSEKFQKSDIAYSYDPRVENAKRDNAPVRRTRTE